MGCCVSVPNQSIAVIEQCGKYQRLANPGLSGLNPLCCESVAGYVNLRVKQLTFTIETKTKDNVFVHITVSVQYQVIRSSIFDSFYTLSNAESQIQSYIYDVVRGSVPKIDLDDVFQQKNEIASSVKEELKKSMEDYGFEILESLITDVEPDPKVKHAMNEINAAQRERQAAVERGETEKILVVKQAEADSESKYLSGCGIARQRKAIVEGLRDSVLEFAEDVDGASPKDVMDLVLVTQYFDTLKDLGISANNNTVFIPGASSNINNDDISNKFALGMMQGKAANC
eukprot:TRINITY_DN528_c0_g2_i2.p1 TRINITY_DN528_c0_g2~~TRINITY_DN528_c0_g2_i2.p1  ORF type:complete len:286 (+),score=106.82 TRINITY_DN528_c0_g2_i2:86-943(+)